MKYAGFKRVGGVNECTEDESIRSICKNAVRNKKISLAIRAVT
jgi:hypothetical protein